VQRAQLPECPDEIVRGHSTRRYASFGFLRGHPFPQRMRAFLQGMRALLQGRRALLQGMRASIQVIRITMAQRAAMVRTV
jgi:hypothetical protein